MSEGFVETNGMRLWYEQLGDPEGEPVVLVMGAGASAIRWPPPLLESLESAGRLVVRFDNRDIGLSSHIDYAIAPYTLDDMATDTLGLLDGLGIRRAHLVGASMGGMIIQVGALRWPDRVRSLTLLITSPGRDARLSPSDPRIAEVAMRPASTPEEVIQRGLDLFRACTGSRFPFDEAYYRNRFQAELARGTNTNTAHSRVSQTAPSRLDALKGLHIPTLIVHGTEDPLLPFDHATAMAEAIAGSALVRWEGVGHEMPPALMPDLGDAIVAHTAATAAVMDGN